MRSFLPALLFVIFIHKTAAEIPTTVDAFYTSFKFLEAEEDTANLEKLSTLVLDKYYSDVRLLDRVFSFYIYQKDRKKVFDIIYTVSVKNSCSRVTQFKSISPTCLQLRSVWLDGLWQLPFYDTTAVLLNEAKENIRAGLCDKALGALEDLERREGPLLQLLETLEDTYRCLKYTEKVRSTQNRIESMRVFDL